MSINSIINIESVRRCVLRHVVFTSFFSKLTNEIANHHIGKGRKSLCMWRTPTVGDST